MRITCPQCQAGYEVDPEKIPSSGLRVRCPQCERVFSVKVAQAASTTMSGQPPVSGPVPTMVGAPRPPAPAGMTMVGMAPPQPPAAATDPDAPVPLPGRAAPPAPPEPLREEEFFPPSGTPERAPEPAEPVVAEPPEHFTSPTGAIPLPAPPGGGTSPHWPPPEDPEVLAATLAPEPAPPDEPFEPIQDLVPDEPDVMDALVEPAPDVEDAVPAEEPPPEPLTFGEVPLDHEAAPDPFAAAVPREPAPADRPDEELEMLFTAGGESAPPPPPPRKALPAGFRIRRPSGRVFGPFSENEIVEMLGKGELNGNEDVAPGDGDDWIAIGVAGPFEAAVKRMNEAPLVPASPAPTAAGSVPAPFQPRMQGGFREKAVSLPMSRKRMVGLGAVAGAVLLVAGVGVAGSLTRHGPFFWKVFRSKSDPAVAKLAAEGRQALALDAYPSDQKALQLAQQGLGIRGDDPQGVRLLAGASAALAARGADGQVARARQLAAALATETPSSPDALEARLAVTLASGEDPAQAAAALEKVLPAQPDPQTLFLLARAALTRGDTARAASLLDRLDAASPGSIRSARLRAAVAVRKGDDAAAAALLEAALAKDPGNAAAALDRAALLEKAGDPGAEPILRGLLEKERIDRLGPAERARARVLLAGALARRGDGAGAEAELAQAAQDWAGATDARVALGRALLRRGEPALAMAALEAIPAASRTAAASAMLARAQFAAGKGAEATATLDAALARAPDDPGLLLVKGATEIRAGRTAEARKAFERAAAKDPAGWEAPLALARLAAADGNLEGAETLLRTAAEKGPAEPEVLAAQGALAFVRGDGSAAEAFYGKALAADPRNAPALSGMARLAMARGDLAGARAFAEKAVASDPGSAEAQLALGWALWRAGEPEPARKALETALALDPRAALARVRLGALLLEQKKSDEAMKQLDHATNLDANLAEAQFWLGKALLAKGETSSALDRLRKATQLAPGEAAYQVQLGEALERSVQLPDAATAYRAAIAAAPRAPEGYEHLGRLFALQGDCKQAMPQFQKALEAAPTRESARIELAGCQAKTGRADGGGGQLPEGAQGGSLARRGLLPHCTDGERGPGAQGGGALVREGCDGRAPEPHAAPVPRVLEQGARTEGAGHPGVPQVPGRASRRRRQEGRRAGDRGPGRETVDPLRCVTHMGRIILASAATRLGVDLACQMEVS